MGDDGAPEARLVHRTHVLPLVRRGEVSAMGQKVTNEKFALKTLNKEFMIKNNRVDNVYKEKQVLL